MLNIGSEFVFGKKNSGRLEHVQFETNCVFHELLYVYFSVHLHNER